MIKQIQLRGISRTPSDRSSSDGGCAESLNVHLDQGETAPTLPPVDISEDIYGESERFPIIFIHKMTVATNYIGLQAASGAKLFRSYGTYNGLMGNASVPSGESLVSVTNVGNALIVYTDAKPYYFLFKDNSYTFLGNEIPKPSVEVLTVPVGARQYQMFPASGLRDQEAYDSTVWNDAKQADSVNHDALVETINNLWDFVTKKVGEYRTEKDGSLFSAPFFLRYALRLYDGQYIYASSPILCGGGSSEDWMTARLYAATVPYIPTRVMIQLNDLFTVHLRSEYNPTGWSDIVTSLDFFASAPIYTPKFDAEFIGIQDSTTMRFVFDGMDSQNREKTIKDELLARGQFYKVASFNISEDVVNDNVQMSRLRRGYATINASDDVSGEKLASHDELPFDYRSGSQYLPLQGCMNFNNRLLLMGANELLGRGDSALNGQVTPNVGSDGTPTVYGYILRFRIVNPQTGESHYVVSHYRDGGQQIYPAGLTTRRNYVYYGNDIPGGMGPYFQGIPYAWISFPDSRCKEVEVYFLPPRSSTPDYGCIIPMEPHPLLEASYAFLGLGVSLMSLRYGVKYKSISWPPTHSENRIVPQPNKLFLSEFENHFVFHAENIITFNDAVVGAAVTSVPLSQGQFGEFPMYVFTDGGIRVLVTSGEGVFAANYAHPNLARHVALPGTIFSMEQTVIFTTEKGVMMLSGGSVTDISREMNGKPYTLEQEVREMLLPVAPWQRILGATNDPNPFMAFMRTAKPAYDSKGARLIFFNRVKQYQYVYMLETQSWHKVYTSVAMATLLNGFPDCLVAWTPNNTPTVLNFSTILDDSGYVSDVAEAVPGIIATRPFDLGEPDIRKAIRSIRIRGRYNRADVQYILLGSFDGIHWQRLKSLRGGSYKQFRLVLLTSLAPTERITWIDIDYESRFTNRLR